LRSVVVFCVLFVTITCVRARDLIARLAGQITAAPVNWVALAGHFAAMAGVAVLSVHLFGGTSSGLLALITWMWLGTGAIAVLLAAVAVIPLGIWSNLVRGSAAAGLYALLAGIATTPAGIAGLSLWKPLTAFTFRTVEALLRPFLTVVADSTNMTLGSRTFQVRISPWCSGIEGMTLMLLFGATWLLVFRREYRFPQALLIIPVGLAVLWTLNVFRIAALILIGHGGAPAVAVGGFHSQAGWVTFTVVALAIPLCARRVPWFAVRPAPVRVRGESCENPTAKYLMPFLAILAAGMVAGAAAADSFERLYPLRLLAAAFALAVYRDQYKRLDWKFGWSGPAVGFFVFLAWLAADRLTSVQEHTGLALGLATLPVPARFAWIAARTFAAVTTVPIAEELAFRGFLLRRLIARDFESVGFRTWTYAAILVSSLAFGLLHGQRWAVGTLAGAVYAGALIHRGRIGDAVAAHATTNALLAASVLGQGRWELW
jgi:exosortase E/protease (VPEID-CTERM system)